MPDRAVVESIRELGATSVELLPVHTCLNQPFLTDHGLTNCGDTTPSACSPPTGAGSRNRRRRVQGDGPALPRAGLEVILDAASNHTPEGNEFGPTLSFNGIDNASNDRLMPGVDCESEGPGPRYCINDTGTGNTPNLSHPSVLQRVTDGLRYGVAEMHVAGFASPTFPRAAPSSPTAPRTAQARVRS